MLCLFDIVREREGRDIEDGGLEVVDHPADGLNVGGLRLPFIMTAVVSSLHDVHTTSEVWLFIHHPAEKHDFISYDYTQFE